MIVVTKNLAGFMQHLAGGVEAPAKIFDSFKRRQVDAAGIRIRSNATIKFLEARYNRLRLVEDFIPRFMGGANGQAVVPAELAEFLFRNRPQPAQLDSLIADGANLFQAASNVRRGLEKIADGVELGSELIGFYLLNPFVNSSSEAVPVLTAIFVNLEFLTSCLRVRW